MRVCICYSRISDPGLAFAYLVDDDRQELDSLSSDVQVRISGTRYGYLCRVLVVLFPTLGTIPPSSSCVVGFSSVCTAYMSYGRSHGHERWNAPASQHTHAHTHARADSCWGTVNESCSFLRPPVCYRTTSSTRGKKGEEGVAGWRKTDWPSERNEIGSSFSD